MWVALMLPYWFDQTRRNFDSEITAFEQVVGMVETRQRQQLSVVSANISSDHMVWAH